MTRFYYHGDRWGLTGGVHTLQWISATQLVSIGSGVMHFWDTEADTLQVSYSLASGQSALSLDGSHLALASESKVVVWNLASHTIVQALDCQTPVTALAWSPDGSLLATGLLTGPIILWSLASGCSVLSYGEHLDRRIHHIAFSPDGNWIASNGFDAGRLEGETCKYLQIWETTSGKLAWYPWEITTYMRSLAWSPDSLNVAIGDEHGGIDLLHLHTQQATPCSPMRWHSYRPIEHVIWSPDGKGLVSVDTTMACVWDMTVDEYSRRPDEYPGHASPLTAIAYAPDGKTIASADAWGQIHLWAPETLRQEYETRRKHLLLYHPG